MLKSVIPACACVIVLAAFAASGALRAWPASGPAASQPASQPVTRPWERWREGDQWHFDVSIYSRPWSLPTRRKDLTELPVVAAIVNVTVRVAGIESVENRPCFVLEMACDGQPESADWSSGLLGQFRPTEMRLYIDRQDGTCRKLKNINEGQVITAPGLASALPQVSHGTGAEPPLGYPSDWFPLYADVENPKTGVAVKTTRERDGWQSVMQYKIGEYEYRWVRQVWRPGEPWWDRFERRFKGKWELTAVRIDPATRPALSTRPSGGDR